MKGAMCIGALAILSLTAPEVQAMTSTLVVEAQRNGGNTSFKVKVCVCLTYAEVISYNAAGGGGTLTIQIGEDLMVTENDLFDDDELNIRIAKGTYSIDPFYWTGGAGCPPRLPQCTVIATILFVDGMDSVPNSDYGNEDPGEFQLGEWGEEEGTVPAGTSASLSQGAFSASSTPSMPNKSS